MMRSRRLHAQKKALFWLGSSWRKKILPKPVSDAIWKRANDVLSCEEHERQISSDTSPFEQNIKVPQRMMPTAPMQLRQPRQRTFANRTNVDMLFPPSKTGRKEQDWKRRTSWAS